MKWPSFQLENDNVSGMWMRQMRSLIESNYRLYSVSISECLPSAHLLLRLHNHEVPFVLEDSLQMDQGIVLIILRNNLLIRMHCFGRCQTDGDCWPEKVHRGHKWVQQCHGIMGRRFPDWGLLRYRKWVPQQLGDVIAVTNSPPIGLMRSQLTNHQWGIVLAVRVWS